VNGHLKNLQKRSALAFLGLSPDANENEINKMYKKMALELHPDKGGDPEKFQELQEMKERLRELDEEDEDGKKKKKDGDDPEDEEDEEAKKEKEKEKEEEEAEKEKLPPNERIKKLRMDVHDNTVRIWERAKKWKDEITGDKALKTNSQPALNILRMFVDRFVNSEIKTLRHDDVRGAESKFRKFVKQGAEIIAVAALQDVQATLSTIAMNFNYRLVARTGSAEMKNKCSALLEAVSEVPVQAEAFIKGLEDRIADAKDREKKDKEERAKEQKEREARGDLSGEAGGQAGASAKAAPKAGAKPPESQATADAKAKAKAEGGADATFADFDFDEKPKPQPKAEAKAQAPPSEALVSKEDEEKKLIAAAMNQQKRTGWDPNFDHPYAGALKSNGAGVYCRQCQRWIMTYEYNLEVFITHVERMHPNRPSGLGAK